jgi:hypothetical protein
MEASVLVIMSLLCVTFLMIGGIIGWLAQQNNLFVQSQQIAYTHPEMYDENGNIIPDEIVAVRFENDNESQEDDDEE